MSEEVKTEEVIAPPAEILPSAKSEDKLEIEKEEQEAKEKSDEADEKKEGEEDSKKEEADENKDDEKKEDETKKEGEENAEDGGGGGGGKEKKRFKMPNLKPPKVPDFLRSKSKERKKVRKRQCPHLGNYLICI